MGVESKLHLIGRADQQRFRRAVQAGNLPAAIASGGHEERMVERHARYGDAMTVIEGPPQQEPAKVTATDKE